MDCYFKIAFAILLALDFKHFTFPQPPLIFLQFSKAFFSHYKVFVFHLDWHSAHLHVCLFMHVAVCISACTSGITQKPMNLPIDRHLVVLLFGLLSIKLVETFFVQDFFQTWAFHFFLRRFPIEVQGCCFVRSTVGCFGTLKLPQTCCFSELEGNSVL